MSKMNRRQAISRTLLGTVGGLYGLEMAANSNWFNRLLLPSLGGTGGTHPFVGGAMGTIEILQSALRGGAGLLRTQQAYAQAGMSDASREWAVVTIKVVNHVHTPLVFKLGKLNEQTGVVTTGSDVDKVKDKMTSAGAHMEAKGVDLLSDNPRFARLRFNKWFADILRTGKSDVVSAAGVPSLDSAALYPGAGDFPEGVAIQAGLHLVQQFTGKNHSLMNFRLRPNEGDLAHFVDKKGIVQSPLGVTAFMMGGRYDRAEGQFETNQVLSDANDIEAPIGAGVSVENLVGALKQSLVDGYGDASAFDQNLTVKFDQVVARDPKLRRAMLDSRKQFKDTIAQLQESADLESTRQSNVTNMTGSVQSVGSGSETTPPTHEFVSQCAFAAKAMKMDGRPLRNFSLFLNMADLDGRNLDGASFGGEEVGIKCYSYVEGMRQLAVGLNILSKVIEEKRNVIVVVVSEGGRSRMMQDQKVGFGLVMAPSGSGMLSDALYANAEAINEENGRLVQEPGDLPNGANRSVLHWSVDGLVSEAGASMKGAAVTTSGDWQLGVAEFLAEKMGVSGVMQGQTQFVKLRRG